MHRFVVLMFAAVLSACATPPFNLDGVNRTITPEQAKANPAGKGQTVVWGGMIIETKTFKDETQIEVLAYPLDDATEPQRSATPQTRILIKHQGFLEPAEFASGRFISALGEIQPTVKGKIGDSEYVYPVLRSKNLHLWPVDDSASERNTRFHFGIGIGVRL